MLNLKTILIVPFLLQILGTVTVVSYLSFWYGERAINNLAHQLMRETSDACGGLRLRLLENINAFLQTPQQITQTNQDLITAKVLDLENENMDAWLPFLFYQYQSNKSNYIGGILLTNKKNNFVAGGSVYDKKTKQKVEGIAVANKENNFTYKGFLLFKIIKIKLILVWKFLIFMLVNVLGIKKLLKRRRRLGLKLLNGFLIIKDSQLIFLNLSI